MITVLSQDCVTELSVVDIWEGPGHGRCHSVISSLCWRHFGLIGTLLSVSTEESRSGSACPPQAASVLCEVEGTCLHTSHFGCQEKAFQQAPPFEDSAAG